MKYEKKHLNAVTIGNKLDFKRVEIDGRTNLGKWLKHIKDNLISDLGGDVTMAEEILIDRIKFKVVNIHFLEKALVKGKSENYQTYTTLTNSLRADLVALGLKRESKDYIPTLKTYVQEKESKKK